MPHWLTKGMQTTPVVISSQIAGASVSFAKTAKKQEKEAASWTLWQNSDSLKGVTLYHGPTAVLL